MAISCLIPTYNEAPRIGYIISKLLKVSNLSEILVIDDGSTDHTISVVRQFPRVTLINHSHNFGKTAAIKTGLKHIKSPNVLLFDADIDFIDQTEVQKSITIFESNLSIDMLVYRTIRDR
ncbi:MAG: cell wall biogenesis glycosyltransferase [uncultured bacterium]|nr:MAG: cell wall biogenesis glycosyltransferase [uncultured bacterium]